MTEKGKVYINGVEIGKIKRRQITPVETQEAIT